MGTSNYSDDFKRDAVHQITVRGYPVREVSRRLGVSTHSLYKWMKLFGDPAPNKPDADWTCRALLSLAEVLLGPFWVWLILGETVTSYTLIGGAVLLAALVGNSLSGKRRPPPSIVTP